MLWGVCKETLKNQPSLPPLWASTIAILQSRIMKAALGGDAPQRPRVRPLETETLYKQTLKRWQVR